MKPRNKYDLEILIKTVKDLNSIDTHPITDTPLQNGVMLSTPKDIKSHDTFKLP